MLNKTWSSKSWSAKNLKLSSCMRGFNCLWTSKSAWKIRSSKLISNELIRSNKNEKNKSCWQKDLWYFQKTQIPKNHVMNLN